MSDLFYKYKEAVILSFFMSSISGLNQKAENFRQCSETKCLVNSWTWIFDEVKILTFSQTFLDPSQFYDIFIAKQKIQWLIIFLNVPDYHFAWEDYPVVVVVDLIPQHFEHKRRAVIGWHHDLADLVFLLEVAHIELEFDQLGLFCFKLWCLNK